MSILIFAIIAIIICALLVTGEEYAIGWLDTRLVRLIQGLTIILCALVIANRAGVV